MGNRKKKDKKLGKHVDRAVDEVLERDAEDPALVMHKMGFGFGDLSKYFSELTKYADKAIATLEGIKKDTGMIFDAILHRNVQETVGRVLPKKVLIAEEPLTDKATWEDEEEDIEVATEYVIAWEECEEEDQGPATTFTQEEEGGWMYFSGVTTIPASEIEDVVERVPKIEDAFRTFDVKEARRVRRALEQDHDCYDMVVLAVERPNKKLGWKIKVLD